VKVILLSLHHETSATKINWVWEPKASSQVYGFGTFMQVLFSKLVVGDASKVSGTKEEEEEEASLNITKQNKKNSTNTLKHALHMH
jgi:DNA topoisomerase VI subunit B